MLGHVGRAEFRRRGAVWCMHFLAQTVRCAGSAGGVWQGAMRGEGSWRMFRRWGECADEAGARIHDALDDADQCFIFADKLDESSIED